MTNMTKLRTSKTVLHLSQQSLCSAGKIITQSTDGHTTCQIPLHNHYPLANSVFEYQRQLQI